jgi:hypothetical protein
MLDISAQPAARGGRPIGSAHRHDATHGHDDHAHAHPHAHGHAHPLPPRLAAPPLSLIALSGWTRLALILPAIALLWLLTLLVTSHG